MNFPTNLSYLALVACFAAMAVTPLHAAPQAPVTSPVPELGGVFLAPPVSAKPHVYSYWVDGNLSTAGITADLEAMARIGIGAG